jgi:drug/metabolite transporter (DMT)-like permease
MSGAPPRWQADLALAGMSLAWGATFVLVKNALADVSPTLFLALRFTIAALVLVLALRARGRLPQWNRQILRGAVLIGVCLCAGYVLQTAGLLFTTPAKSGFLTGLYIPLVPLLSALVYHSVPQTSEWVGALVAAGGLVLLTLPDDLSRINRGDLLTIGCAAAFGFHLMAIDRYTKRFDYRQMALGQIATAAVACWIFAPLLDHPVHIRWTPAVLWALGITSLVATALAFFLMTWAQQYTTPTRAAIILALEPVFAWITSFLVEGEVLSWRAGVGALLILAGILLAELKPLGRSVHPDR